MRALFKILKHIILTILILFGFWLVTLEDPTARSIMGVFSLVGWVVFVNWLGKDAMDVDKFFREIDEERAKKSASKDP